MHNPFAPTKSSKSSKPTVYLVTGANGAIGKAIAIQLANNHNAKVVVVCRNQNKAEKVADEIINTSQNPNVRFELADLSRYDDIHQLAKCWTGPLHVLINNAACTPPSRQETPEGIELQFATNVLGYFWLINEFTDILKTSAPARIINVASYWAGGLDIDDLEFTHRKYNNAQSYRQSKQANRMLSTAFSKRLKTYAIAVNACHPGDVSSTLSNNLGFGGHATAEQCAKTPVWLAKDPIGQLTTGRYFEHMRELPCDFSQDWSAIDALFDVCSNYTEQQASQL